MWSGYPVKLFGVTLPAWGIKNPALKDAMSEVHLVTSFVLLALVLLHIAGALHHALRRDGIASRMSFGGRATTAATRGALARRRLTGAQSGAYFRGARAACSSSSTVGACLNSRAISSAFLPRLSTGSTRAPASINTRAVSVWP